MKTTLKIPDGIFRRAKSSAAQRGPNRFSRYRLKTVRLALQDLVSILKVRVFHEVGTFGKNQEL
jgi:hypothetical protein